MSTSQLRDRIAALRAEAARSVQQLAAHGAGMGQEELFEVTGELQGVANAVEGAQLVAIAHAGSHELRLTERGPVDVHHEVGFIDAMTSSEVSLATGLGPVGRRAQGRPGRSPGRAVHQTVGQSPHRGAGHRQRRQGGRRLRRPRPRRCAAVEDVLVERLVGMDPARITTVARKVATRIAADQVAAATAKNKKDRAVQVTPGPDGTTDWWARLPAGRSAAAWAAIRDLADRYTKKDPEPDPGPGQRRRVHRPAADQRHRHRQSHPRHPRHHRPRRRARPSGRHHRTRSGEPDRQASAATRHAAGDAASTTGGEAASRDAYERRGGDGGEPSAGRQPVAPHRPAR